MRYLVFSLFLVVLVGAPAPARAADAAQLSAAERIQQAKAHFDRGQALFEKAQFAAAALEFQAAYEFQPLALLLWNAAQAYRKAGDDDQATDYYKRYLDADPKSNKRAAVEKILAELDFKQKVANATPPTEAPAPPRPQAGDTEQPPFSQLALAQAQADRAAAQDAAAPVVEGSGRARARGRRRGAGGRRWRAVGRGQRQRRLGQRQLRRLRRRARHRRAADRRRGAAVGRRRRGARRRGALPPGLAAQQGSRRGAAARARPRECVVARARVAQPARESRSAGARVAQLLLTGC